MSDSTAVSSMFGRIAGRYDLANRVLSVGLDLRWRAVLVGAVRRGGAKAVLDLATGSGDVAFALSRGLAPGARILGIDFCPPMLDRARQKQAAAAPRYAAVAFQAGDALALPLPDAAFDAVTIAFGLRNLADRARGLAEMRRVLRPGGRLFVLEFSQPHPWIRPIYGFYLRRILPHIAAVLTREPSAYLYLGDTIGKFPDRAALTAEMQAAGFAPVTARPLSLGIVALHEAIR